MITCTGCGAKLKNRHGYPNHVKTTPACTSEKRFWGNVDKSRKDGCWWWLGHQDHHSYGVFRYDGKNRRAHRLAWILTNGHIPEGKHVLHRCDNPPCVNPAHMFLGSHHENMLDCASKGRVWAGGNRRDSTTYQQELARRNDKTRKGGDLP